MPRPTILPRAVRPRARRRALGSLLALGCALTAPASAAVAQEPGVPAGQRDEVLPPPLRRCDGQVVTEVDIRPQPPELGGVASRVREFLRVGRVPHVTTRPEVIGRFLAVREGERCTELRRQESERLLRAQPYLADADVVAYPDGPGRVRVIVTTVDELTPILGLGIGSGARPTALRLGDGNVLGRGLHLSGLWRQGALYRDVYGARVVSYQTFGRPYQLELAGTRRMVGGDWEAGIINPFFYDLQRFAWRAQAGESRDYFQFRRVGEKAGALSVERSFWDMGGIVRVGRPGRLSLFGVSLTGEDDAVAGRPVRLGPAGLEADTTSALFDQYGAHTTARFNFLWGVRNINFMRVTGFDALTAPQDVRRGFQLGVLFGRSIPALGSEDDDRFVAGDVYAGYGGPRSFVALQARGEGREDGDSRRFDGVVAAGRVAWYTRPLDTHTLVVSAEGAALWNPRLPVQLAIGHEGAGVRGYGESQAVGSQRAVVRVEERWSMGRFRRLADLGIAAFVDGGRVWAGDAPFGMDTPLQLGAGIGILAAVPPRSQKLWRVDVAIPIVTPAVRGLPASARPGRGIELRFSSRDLTRSFWSEPDDVTRSRGRTVPVSIFSWP